MPSWAVELGIIVLLAMLNGFFAAAEIAILTARRGRLELLAEEGDGASAVALRLARDADRFLPTVQVGITLVGTFTSAFAGAKLEVLIVSSAEADPEADRISKRRADCPLRGLPDAVSAADLATRHLGSAYHHDRDVAVAGTKN